MKRFMRFMSGPAEAGVVLATLADVGPRDREEQVGLDGAVSAIAR